MPRLLTIKGAPDVLINRCTHYVTATGATAPLGTETKGLYEDAKNKFSSQGKRCILLARKILHNAKDTYGDPTSTDYEKAMTNQATSGLTLVGLVGIVDPLRPEIVDVVSTLRGAGVRIAMVRLHVPSDNSAHHSLILDLTTCRSQETSLSLPSPSPATPAL